MNNGTLWWFLIYWHAVPVGHTKYEYTENCMQKDFNTVQVHLSKKIPSKGFKLTKMGVGQICFALQNGFTTFLRAGSGIAFRHWGVYSELMLCPVPYLILLAGVAGKDSLFLGLGVVLCRLDLTAVGRPTDLLYYSKATISTIGA